MTNFAALTHQKKSPGTECSKDPCEFMKTGHCDQLSSTSGRVNYVGKLTSWYGLRQATANCHGKAKEVLNY